MGNENLFEWDFVPTLSELLYDAMLYNDRDDFYYVFDLLSQEEIADHIDRYIEKAINYNRPEFTVFLLDYKAKHNLYTIPNWDI